MNDEGEQEWQHCESRWRVGREADGRRRAVVLVSNPNLSDDGEFLVYEGWPSPSEAADFLERVAKTAQRKAAEAANYATMIREQAAAFRKMDSEPPTSGEKE